MPIYDTFIYLADMTTRLSAEVGSLTWDSIQMLNQKTMRIQRGQF